METYVFLGTSKAYEIYTQQQSQLNLNSQIRKLKHLAVDAVYSTNNGVLATLQIIMEGDDRAKAVEAQGILVQVKCFKHLVNLVLFWHILSCTKSLSDLLQSTQTDLAEASDLIETTSET